MIGRALWTVVSFIAIGMGAYHLWGTKGIWWVVFCLGILTWINIGLSNKENDR